MNATKTHGQSPEMDAIDATHAERDVVAKLRQELVAARALSESRRQAVCKFTEERDLARTDYRICALRRDQLIEQLNAATKISNERKDEAGVYFQRLKVAEEIVRQHVKTIAEEQQRTTDAKRITRKIVAAIKAVRERIGTQSIDATDQVTHDTFAEILDLAVARFK